MPLPDGGQGMKTETAEEVEQSQDQVPALGVPVEAGTGEDAATTGTIDMEGKRERTTASNRKNGNRCPRARFGSWRSARDRSA